jgi:hypothetical protein
VGTFGAQSMRVLVSRCYFVKTGTIECLYLLDFKKVTRQKRVSRCARSDPKSGASANFATFAFLVNYSFITA